MPEDPPEKGDATAQDDVYRTPEANVVRPAEPGRIQLASRWRRLFGAILDGMILNAVIVPFMFSSGYLERYMEDTTPTTEPFKWALVFFIAYFVINGITLHWRGQTLGKMTVSTQIVSFGDHQLLPLWKIIALRLLPISVLTAIPVVGLIFAFINVLPIFRKDRRCGHDHIAGTVVIDYVPRDLLKRNAAA